MIKFLMVISIIVNAPAVFFALSAGRTPPHRLRSVTRVAFFYAVFALTANSAILGVMACRIYLRHHP